ncbi:MAG TPA: hypothetical protein VF669_19545 [Tepidisphaeraceae bacterium]
MSAFVTIFILFAFFAIGMTLFAGFGVFLIVRAFVGGTLRLLGGGESRVPVQHHLRPRGTMPSNATRCSRSGCRAMNPLSARYCRRCGAQLPTPQRVEVVRRAAVW